MAIERIVPDMSAAQMEAYIRSSRDNTAGEVKSVAGLTGNITKADLNIENVTNVADADKIVSDLTQNELDKKIGNDTDSFGATPSIDQIVSATAAEIAALDKTLTPNTLYIPVG